MTKMHEATKLGQSIWLDYMHRTMLKTGELKQLIDAGLRGITSNPTIFEEAIGSGDAYDDAMRKMVEQGKSVGEMYQGLVVEDIRNAADQLRPIYAESKGNDGYVSLEADPNLAYDSWATVEEVHHLRELVDRPNVMFKVPATGAGIPAISQLISEGININITLMFSLNHYEAVADAYLRGLEKRAAKGEELSQVASVASFFVSRVDTLIDKELDKLGQRDLKGKIGIANAKMAYARYLTIFSSERWQQLERQGARPQRILYGSTSTKNPDYPDTLYIDNLMGANTVNTLPRKAIDALMDHGMIASGLTANLDEARRQINQLASLGLNLEVLTQHLQDEGVEKFAKDFSKLSDAIAKKREQFQRVPA